MHRFQWFVTIVICVSVMPIARGAEERDHLTYTVPIDAVRAGPFGTRDPEVTFFEYFAKGVDRSRTNRIAREKFANGSRISLELFKNGVKHGVQREWFSNGQLKSEFPYRKGLMHGTFKHRDESGKLIGQYEMTDGVGLKHVFYSNGHMEVESAISNNVLNGLTVTFHSSGQLASLGWFANDKSTGQGVGFHDDGSIYMIGWSDGPMFYYDEHGSPSKKVWRVKGAEVSEAEYKAVASQGRASAPYFSDVAQYRAQLDEPIKALIARYHNVPRVKIPLELDQKGKATPDTTN